MFVDSTFICLLFEFLLGLLLKVISTELGQKNARCKSLRALLPYVEWDRFVTLAGSKSGLRVTLSYLGFICLLPSLNVTNGEIIGSKAKSCCNGV